MMNMLDTLRRTGGLEALSRIVDLSPAEAADGARILLPLVLAGFKRLSQSLAAGEDGLALLVARLELQGGAQLAAAVVLPGQTPSAAIGTALATELYSGAEGVMAVAGAAARRCDIDSAKLRRMLPLLIMLVGGYIAARADRLEGTGSSVADLLELDRPGNPLEAIL